MNIKHVTIGIFRDGLLVECDCYDDISTKDYLIECLDIIQLKGGVPIGCKRCIQYTISDTNEDVIITFADQSLSDSRECYEFRLNSRIVKESVNVDMDLCAEHAHQQSVNDSAL